MRFSVSMFVWCAKVTSDADVNSSSDSASLRASAPARVRVDERRAAVDDRALLRAQPSRVEVLEQGEDELALVGDGVAAVAEALHHVERVDAVGA